MSNTRVIIINSVYQYMCMLPLGVFADLDLQRPRLLGTNLGVGFTKVRVLNRSCITAETLAGVLTGVPEVVGNTTDCVCVRCVCVCVCVGSCGCVLTWVCECVRNVFAHAFRFVGRPPLECCRLLVRSRKTTTRWMSACDRRRWSCLRTRTRRRKQVTIVAALLIHSVSATWIPWSMR